MRRYLHDRVDARLLLGGRRGSGTDAPPGVMEEAVMAIEGGRPVYVAGGFGGVTADIAQALGHDDGSWLRLTPDPDAHGPGYRDHYRRLTELAAAGAVADNGPTAEENRLLAISHRPADIAALVTVGLGRWAKTVPAEQRPTTRP
ncbi:hypothetical protein AB0368_30325 [Actinoplanes sp. NPDC051475]|uniref:hypothetical protein n=1 Tax=Actinoplanes sp. NPDC051475 TaxID=3157225 RepID=UPI00344FBBBF